MSLAETIDADTLKITYSPKQFWADGAFGAPFARAAVRPGILRCTAAALAASEKRWLLLMVTGAPSQPCAFLPCAAPRRSFFFFLSASPSTAIRPKPLSFSPRHTGKLQDFGVSALFIANDFQNLGEGVTPSIGTQFTIAQTRGVVNVPARRRMILQRDMALGQREARVEARRRRRLQMSEVKATASGCDPRVTSAVAFRGSGMRARPGCAVCWLAATDVVQALHGTPMPYLRLSPDFFAAFLVGPFPPSPSPLYSSLPCRPHHATTAPSLTSPSAPTPTSTTPTSP